MPTYNAVLKDVIRMDGSNGAYTVNLPVGSDGFPVTFSTKGKVPVNLTLNAQAGDSLELPDGTVSSSASFTIIREGFQIVYDAPNSTWLSMNNWAAQVFADLVLVAPPITIPTGSPGALTPIPLAYGRGDDELFTIEPNGSLTAKYAALDNIEYLLDARLDIALNLGTQGNNNMIVSRFAWIFTGNGTNLSVPSTATIAHSRNYSADIDVTPAALWKPDVGDNAQLVGQVQDSDGSPTCSVGTGIVNWQTVESA